MTGPIQLLLIAGVVLLSAGPGAAQEQPALGMPAAVTASVAAFLVGVLCALVLVRRLGWRQSKPVPGGVTHAILNKLTSLSLALDAMGGAMHQKTGEQSVPQGLEQLMRRDLENLAAIAHALEAGRIPERDST